MLLHERLRKYAKDGVGVGTDSPVVQMLKEYQLTPRLKNVYGEAVFLRKLADEIERRYIPLLVDPEGEPWRIGDQFVAEYDNGPETHRIEGIRHIENPDFGWDKWALVDNNGVSHGLSKCQRPAPKVLDADDVEIKVGDEVYSLLNDGEEPFGTCYVVTAIDASRELPVSCGHWCQREWLFKGTSLTHKEPDSLEQLRDDLMAAHESWDGDPNKLVDYADRLTALIERGA